MPQRANTFTIPATNGELTLHVVPGPCNHEEHWMDPLQLGFRDSLRCHMALHGVIGLCCVMIQIGSKTVELTWYSRTGLGTWAGTLFFITCLIGSFAANAEMAPRYVRSWLHVYAVFCFLSGWLGGTLALMHMLNYHLHLMADWQSGILAVLGMSEFLFCIVEFTLVVYRLCSAGSPPQGFDLHLTVECSTEGTTLVSPPASDARSHPPPSYEQILSETRIPRSVSAELLARTGVRRAIPEDERSDIGLRILSRASLQTFLSRSSAAAG